MERGCDSTRDQVKREVACLGGGQGVDDSPRIIRRTPFVVDILHHDSTLIDMKNGEVRKCGQEVRIVPYNLSFPTEQRGQQSEDALVPKYLGTLLK